MLISVFRKLSFFILLVIIPQSFIYSQFSLSFGGTDAYASLGNDTVLGLKQFSLECWFMSTGNGTAASTGTYGLNAVPLVAKGRAESDGSTLDMNYFLGIDGTTGVLAADFEEGNGQPSPGLNHPVYGITQIMDSVWYHACVTYDGNEWNLYLNGFPEGYSAPGVLPQFRSLQPASLASALNSSGTAAGFFKGVIDEVRIWNYARTRAEILSTINAHIAGNTPGLVAAWGLNEGTGAFISDSSGHQLNGTILGTDYAWLAGNAPFNAPDNLPPDNPSFPFPHDSATCMPFDTEWSIFANDPDGDTLTVTYYLRPKPVNAPPPFTIVVIPDMQYYTGELNGGSNEIFKSQMRWVADNIYTKNIVFAELLGDMVQNGDNGGNDIEWRRCDTSMRIIEDTALTLLPEGLPYGVIVGNHDQTPEGDANGSTLSFNMFFGVSRFTGRAYYGGHFGSDNNTNFCLFSAGGLDFIILNFGYDQARDTAELNWAHRILDTYTGRRAIIGSHYILNSDGSFSGQGLLLYDSLKRHDNVFMTLSGHVPGESSRNDICNGNTVYSFMSDYQGYANGGNGWLRLCSFSPAENRIFVKTYSPWLDMWKTDPGSEFSVPYTMYPAAYYLPAGSAGGVTPGTYAGIYLQGLQPGTEYEWYTVVSDGRDSTTGPVWSFTTAEMPSVNIGSDTAICRGCSVVLNAGNQYFSYLWNDSSARNTLTVTDAGIYSVTVTDSAGCISSDSIIISISTTGLHAAAGNTDISVFPNPFRERLTITSNPALHGNAFAEMTSIEGRILFSGEIVFNEEGKADLIFNKESWNHTGVCIFRLIGSHETAIKKIIRK